MSAHIHTYTYMHTHIQNVHMKRTQARLEQRRSSERARSRCRPRKLCTIKRRYTPWKVWTFFELRNNINCNRFDLKKYSSVVQRILFKLILFGKYQKLVPTDGRLGKWQFQVGGGNHRAEFCPDEKVRKSPLIEALGPGFANLVGRSRLSGPHLKNSNGAAAGGTRRWHLQIWR